MISYDFPRILGKSGVYLIQPPKICAGLCRTRDGRTINGSRKALGGLPYRQRKELDNLLDEIGVDLLDGKAPLHATMAKMVRVRAIYS